ncbi:MAG: excinuclease ABC subunit UvrB [Clostridia bacterium]|nr:excinuclease ABC subunit UvrB [Clostridia bacterium]
MNMEFKVHSKFKPTGDQPEAIEKIVNRINDCKRFNTLLGVTGSGKTFTMANVIERTGKPTLILAHNKTLAAQLYEEFKEFFPENAVEYFVSYYDYYQPEAYVPSSDTYIEKDASINDEIEKLRHSATAALFERKDVIIIASVSCIYSLGDPIDYENLVLSLRPGIEKDRDDVLRKLVEIQYARNDIDFRRGTFRVRGDVVEIYPAGAESAVRVEFFGDEIDRIVEINPLTGEVIAVRKHISIFPASHYVSDREKVSKAVELIGRDLDIRLKELREENKLVEAQRLEQRTRFDMEMLKEMGFCQGIENYARYISGREAGSTPYTLIDYFGDDFLIMIDESHVTLPQVRAMYNGDRARKQNLVDFGFRLPSALDNRPLNFTEFEEKVNQILFVSATPSDYEKDHTDDIAEQIIRPTGLLDPEVEVRPIEGQIDDLIGEINERIDNNERTLVTTLTKRMAEDLTKYLKEAGISVEYLHSDIKTLERIETIRRLRLGEIDVIVGINLLREGLDIPEVTLVAILDADKEGFLRSETSLIQTIGRAARNSDGRVIMYADNITRSMENAISETNRRRDIQHKYNVDNDIIPKTIKKSIKEVIRATEKAEEYKEDFNAKFENMKMDDQLKHIEKMEKEMKKAASNLDFETAAYIRDQVITLKGNIKK